MVIVQSATDVEVYSANSAGGFQGNGYQCRNAGYVIFVIAPSHLIYA
jgi:hypothetical protein